MENKIKTVLVTGGAGFIGSHVCELLLREGFIVVCLDNFNNYYNPLQKEKNIESCLGYDRFFLVRGDICEIEIIEKVFEMFGPISTVVHLAAAVGVRHSLVDPDLYYRVNVLGTENILTVSENYNVAHIIFASSSSVYGEQVEGPFKDGSLIFEKPLSPYAETKRLGECAMYDWHKRTGGAATCFRFFTVYGPRGRRDMAPYLFTDRIMNNQEIIHYGDGSSMRDYTYVSDIATGIVNAVMVELSGFEILNLGAGNPYTLWDFTQAIEKVINKKAVITLQQFHSADVFMTHADISRAQEKINYQPSVSLDEGLKKLAEWFLSSQHVRD